MAARLAQCGTLSGYRRHRRLGEPACEPCREANKAYQRERYQRIRGTSQGDFELARRGARTRALERLGRLHPTEFRELLNDEVAKLGMPPIEEHARPRKAVIG